MAKAIREPSPVTLELSAEEAETLYDITGRIGGSSESSRRGHMDNIREALERVGFEFDGRTAPDLTGSLDFGPRERGRR